MKLRRILCLLLIPTGLALAIYGVTLVLGLDSIRLGKFSAEAADTSVAFIVVLFGVALAFYGLFGSALVDQQKK